VYITLTFPSGFQYHTDQWWLDPKESDWDVATLIVQIKDEVNATEYPIHLERTAVRCPSDEMVQTYFSEGDVVAVVLGA